MLKTLHIVKCPWLFMAKLGDQVCKKMITKKTKPTKKPTPYLPDLEELHLIIFIFLITVFCLKYVLYGGRS